MRLTTTSREMVDTVVKRYSKPETRLREEKQEEEREERSKAAGRATDSLRVELRPLNRHSGRELTGWLRACDPSNGLKALQTCGKASRGIFFAG